MLRPAAAIEPSSAIPASKSALPGPKATPSCRTMRTRMAGRRLTLLSARRPARAPSAVQRIRSLHRQRVGQPHDAGFGRVEVVVVDAGAADQRVDGRIGGVGGIL